MRVITHKCPECSTIIAANELDNHRVMGCPGLGCETVLRFEDLPEQARQHFLGNRDEYRLE